LEEELVCSFKSMVDMVRDDVWEFCEFTQTD
jgi:hypothetical protein